MTSTEPLKPCPYREARQGHLLCKVSSGGIPAFQNGRWLDTSLTTVEICRDCSVPTITQQVNCDNLNVGKQHRVASSETLNRLPSYQFQAVGLSIDCGAIGFSQGDEYKEKCSIECSSFRPIHRDISQEEHNIHNNSGVCPNSRNRSFNCRNICSACSGI
jgi:hypothetical protein